IADPRLVTILERYVRRTVYQDGLYRDVTQGISLGCPLSPLIAAHYLKPLDERLEATGLFYARFMDDWVVLAPTRWKLRWAARLMQQTLAELKVQTHPGKTFLGRTARGRRRRCVTAARISAGAKKSSHRSWGPCIVLLRRIAMLWWPRPPWNCSTMGRPLRCRLGGSKNSGICWRHSCDRSEKAQYHPSRTAPRVDRDRGGSDPLAGSTHDRPPAPRLCRLRGERGPAFPSEFPR